MMKAFQRLGRGYNALKTPVRAATQASRLVQTPKVSFSTAPTVSASRAESHQVRVDIPRGKNRVPYDVKVGDVIHGFRVETIERIDFFDINAYKLEHLETGARWLHLDSSDLDNVFAVLFRTPPDDHTGKPHILEHLALCGSRHYPVRDPFFNMLKRSLNTYMNAWTGSDFTMYPFSTQNAQDYRNLLSVYTDCAFFPNLDYNDFRQEGHRLEFEVANDPSSKLQYKGVVYNEMKGAMSNPDDSFLHKINENLFTDAQYKFNSGGEPKHITDLTYEELVAFHKMYYHPTNSTFFTYGDLDFREHLKFVETEVLKPNFKRNTDINSEILLDPIRQNPIYKEEQFQPDLMSPPDKQAKLGLSYLLNFDPQKNAYETFCMHVLSNILLEGPNAPFYKSIIEAGVAPNFCPGAGFDHTTRQATFTLGVQGISDKELADSEKALTKTLIDVMNDGIDKDSFDETLHQIEMGAKKTKQNTGLMYISHMVPYALHGGDPLSIFQIDEFSTRIKEEFAKGGLFERLIEKHLTSNRHFLKLLYIADAQKQEREDAKE